MTKMENCLLTKMENCPLGLSPIGLLYPERMSETKSRLLQAGGSSVCRAELICPRPRRASSVPFVLDSLTRFGPKAKGCLPVRMGNHGFEILDGILTKDELEGDSDASNQIGFLRGSPPVRTSNPVVKDVEFAKLALLSSPLGSSLGMKPSRHDKGSPSCGSLGTSPKVRIEGFACGSPESGRVVPAFA